MAEQRVAVDGARIRKMAEVLQNIGLEVDRLEGIVAGLKINPGHVHPTAEQLRARFQNQVVNNGKTTLGNLYQLLYNMGGRLVKLAGVYDTTEDLNTGDVERLRGLVSEVQKYFPEFTPFPPDPSGPPPAK